jgi:hypothetical protein
MYWKKASITLEERHIHRTHFGGLLCLSLLYAYLMGTWWEHIGNFKNPKRPKDCPLLFLKGKQRKEKKRRKTETFWGFRDLYAHDLCVLSLRSQRSRII